MTDLAAEMQAWNMTEAMDVERGSLRGGVEQPDADRRRRGGRGVQWGLRRVVDAHGSSWDMDSWGSCGQIRLGVVVVVVQESRRQVVLGTHDGGCGSCGGEGCGLGLLRR